MDQFNTATNIIEDPNTGYGYELIPYDDREKFKITRQLLTHVTYLERIKSELSDNTLRFMNRPYLDKLDELIATTSNLRSLMLNGHVYKARRCTTDLYYYKISILVDVCTVHSIYLKTVNNIERYDTVKEFISHLKHTNALSLNEASRVISIEVVDKDTYERRFENE